MLVRRLIAAVIHNQKRRILTASRTTTSGAGGREKSSPLNVASGPANTLTKLIFGRDSGLHKIVSRLLLRAFSLHRLETNNAVLATNRINGTLQYSIGMSPKEHSRQSSPVVDEPLGDDAMTSNNTNSQSSGSSSSSGDSQSVRSRLEKYEDQAGGKTLDSLAEAYAGACKSKDSFWLDFADKSIYVYLYKGGGQASDSLAAFDLDGTLIKPKSNKRIPRSATDWDLFSVWTKSSLQRVLSERRSRFVIFTNQNGVGLEIVPLEEVQQRIELVMKKLDIPCTVFMATEKDEFRKPRLGMFWLFTQCFNDSTRLDFTSSFYCGDAIGYPSHSDADIKFAQQLDLPFVTPEKFLRGVKPKLVQ